MLDQLPMAADFDPTRSAALARLQAFLPSAGRAYANTRNADYGPDDRSNVSILSPYIRHRLLLETEVLDAVLGRFALSTSEKFVQEVFWRTYFKGWLEQRPSVWTAYRDDVTHFANEIDGGGQLAKRYHQAVGGRTGIACFDAWSQELIETGYLHNHARMWFASIWIFTLDLPWQLGADFFYRHLLDGDPASNTCSWRWVGGLHTRGKTYLARPDNIEKYTNGRFAPHGELASSAPPLEEAEPHGKRPVRDCAARLPDSPVMLLITEEDASPETLFAQATVKGAITIRATSDRSPFQIGERVAAFADGAMADARSRTSEAFGSPVQDAGDETDWAQLLVEQARALGVTDIVTAFAPVGPVAEKLAEARPKLSEADMTLHEYRRPFDDLAWPHATRGFFALKTKIPNILEDLERGLAPRLL
ncbi:MAG: FAD-binding domain-containing protein [Pseudomonadota bacterium]